MKILLIGGTGAMGKPLINILSNNIDNSIYITSRSERSSEKKNVHFLQGNAHEFEFLSECLSRGFDVVVDFMVYSSEEFEERVDFLLSSTKQYVFLSSSRVYMGTNSRLVEDSPRLLDVTHDQDFIDSDDYPLYKAKEENLLFSNKKNNWTIIRPYITYGSERLQLGTLEKERWVFRAMHGRTILFSQDVAKKITSLTAGYDVALGMSAIIGKTSSFGEAYHIVTDETHTWMEIMNVYLDTLESVLGFRPRIFLEDNGEESAKLLGYLYQYKYDRMFDRRFNSKKIGKIIQIDYHQTLNGISEDLRKFVVDGRSFRWINWKYEALADIKTNEHTPLSQIPKWNQRLKYLFYRYTPYFYIKSRL